MVTNARVPSLSVHHYLGILRARVEWSNGYEESKDRFWNAERGKHYVLLALELNPGQKTEDVTVEIRTSGDELLLEPLPEPLREPRKNWLEEFFKSPGGAGQPPGGAGGLPFLLSFFGRFPKFTNPCNRQKYHLTVAVSYGLRMSQLAKL
jgi:hypothetical protein